MSDDIWAVLQATPIAQVRRRAAIIGEIGGVRPMVVDGAERFAWNDRCGQSAVWYFTQDGRALLLTFERESALNLYADRHYAVQESLYGGVPEDLVRLVRDRPDNYESMNLRDLETGKTIFYASGVFWFDGEQWRPAEGMLDYCDEKNLDPFRESGFGYCVDGYQFGQKILTPETVVEYRAAMGSYIDDDEKESELAAIREVFSRHG